MNLIERSIDPRPTASHVPICERQRHTEKACQRIVMCRRERARSGYFPIAWREANCSTRRDSSPVAACPARRLWSRPYAVRSHISFTGRTASNSLRRAGAVGCLQHDRAAAALPTSRRADRGRRLPREGPQPQAMNAWRRSTSSPTFAPTGNVTLVAT